MKIRYPLFAPEGDTTGGGGTLLSSAAPPAQGAATTMDPPKTGDDGQPAPFDFRSSLDDNGNFKAGWHNSLPDDLKPYASAVEKYPNPTELIRGLGNAQSLLGKRQTVQPPGADAKPEEVEAWRNAIGVPKTPEEYGFKKPENLPKGVEWSEAAVKDFSALAHKLNLTPAQANALLDYDSARQGTAYQTGEAKLGEFVKAQSTALQQEWGDKFKDNVSHALKAAQILGLDPNDPEIGNSAKVIKALYMSSQLMSEDKLVGAGHGNGMTNKQQADDILNNPNNPHHKAYHGKEGPERQKEAQQIRFNLMGYKA